MQCSLVVYLEYPTCVLNFLVYTVSRRVVVTGLGLDLLLYSTQKQCVKTP